MCGKLGKARRVALSTVAAAIGLVSPFTVAEARSQAAEIANVARQVREGQWEWTAYVVAPPGELERVRCVVYTLHPTFPNPVQRICHTSDAKYPFGLTAKGWGVFNLLTRIEFTDGSSKDVVHYVNFSNPYLD
jgi:transcription initiation factor IIF auxiliary subunit